MHFITYILLTLTMFIWGGTFIAGRLLADSLSAPSAAFLRFFIATVCLVVLMKVSKEKFPKPSINEWISLSILGLTGVFLYNVFFFTGLQIIDAGRAALIIATAPLTITLLAVFFSGETLNTKKIVGILISLTGAVLVITNGHPLEIFHSGLGKGEVYIIGCVLSWATYTLVGKKLLTSMSPLSSVCYSSFAGTLMLLIPAITGDLFDKIATLHITDWLSLSYLGILGTAVGFSWYYKGIQRIGATRAGVFINLVPVSAIILAWLILGESIKPSVLTGGMMVLSGVAITNHSKNEVDSASSRTKSAFR